MQVAAVAALVQTALIDDYGRGGEQVEMQGLLSDSQLGGVELPRSVGPVERADKPLLPIKQLLPAYARVDHAVLRIADLYPGLTYVEGVPEQAGRVVLSRRTSVLALKVEVEPRLRLCADVDQDATQPVALSAVWSVFIAFAALETKAVRNAKLEPLGGLLVELRDGPAPLDRVAGRRLPLRSRPHDHGGKKEVENLAHQRLGLDAA
ncbi:MAG: hypothetical protein R2748_21950 [Bryobacterales bacterium]